MLSVIYLSKTSTFEKTVMFNGVLDLILYPRLWLVVTGRRAAFSVLPCPTIDGRFGLKLGQIGTK